MGTIRAVAFDLEGTILDLEALHHDAHLRAAREQGLEIDREVAISLIPHFIGGPDDAVAEDFARASGGGVDPVRFLKTKDELFGSALAGLTHIPLRDGFVEVQRWFAHQGYPMALGSVVNREQVSRLLSLSGLDALFASDAIVAREDVLEAKPAPDVYRLTARRMHALPSQQLVFEDSPVGVRAAAQAGSFPVAVPAVLDKNVFTSLLEAGARRIFWSWTEIRPEGLLASLTEATSA